MCRNRSPPTGEEEVTGELRNTVPVDMPFNNATCFLTLNITHRSFVDIAK